MHEGTDGFVENPHDKVEHSPYGSGRAFLLLHVPRNQNAVLYMNYPSSRDKASANKEQL